MAIQIRNDGVIQSDLVNAETSDGVRIIDLMREGDSLIAVYNERFNALVEDMGYVTTQPDADRVSQIVVKWQRKNQHGAPDARSRTEYDVAVTTALEAFETPIYWTKWAQVLRARSDIFRAYFRGMLEEHRRRLYQHMWEQFFDNVARTVEDVDSELPVTQLPFYNGDSRTPPPVGGKVFSSGHNHYLRTATEDAIVAADLDNLVNTVTEHGYQDYPIIFGSQTTVDGIMAIGGDVIAKIQVMSPIIPRDAVNANQPGALVPIAVPFSPIMDAVGSFKGKATIAVAQDAPDGYIGAYSMQLDRLENPLQFRLPQRADLRGIRRESGELHPFVGEYYSTIRGISTRRFGNGAAMQWADWSGAGYAAPTINANVF